MTPSREAPRRRRSRMQRGCACDWCQGRGWARAPPSVSGFSDAAEEKKEPWNPRGDRRVSAGCVPEREIQRTTRADSCLREGALSESSASPSFYYLLVNLLLITASTYLTLEVCICTVLPGSLSFCCFCAAGSKSPTLGDGRRAGRDSRDFPQWMEG